MRIDLGLILAIIVEYTTFLYYADTVFYRKRSKAFCYTAIAIAHVINMVSCMIGIVWINVLTQISGHIISLLLCYHVKIKSATLQSMMLALFMFADELFVVLLPGIKIGEDPVTYLPEQSLLLTVISRFLYIIEIMLISRIFAKRKKNQGHISITLWMIPMLALSVLMLSFYFPNTGRLISCVVMILINVLVFVIDQKMFRNEMETEVLKETAAKEKIDYEEYKLLLEKYEQTRIFRHDMNEHLTVLGSLIGQDNVEAKGYIEKIIRTKDAVRFTGFSNNKILNILLSKKKGECEEKGISLTIDPILADVSFIDNVDTVSLFSNLINNAIENSEKTIFINVSTTNENFVLIRVSNDCFYKPVVVDDMLTSLKKNSELHGIGMRSIKRVAEKYKGHISWDYDEKNKIFTTVVVLSK